MWWDGGKAQSYSMKSVTHGVRVWSGLEETKAGVFKERMRKEQYF